MSSYTPISGRPPINGLRTTIENTSGEAVPTSLGITAIGHGVKVVASAGTDVALSTTTACKRAVIQAQTDNTNLVAVGGAGVDATVATGTGVALAAGDAFEIEITDLSAIYIDAVVSGEGVRYTYFT